MEYVLLRSCLSLLKFVFILHIVPPSFIRDAVRALDSALQDAVMEILDAPMSTWSWHKATMPVFLGGLGICLASFHAAAAFISSLSQSSSLMASILCCPPPLSHHAGDSLSSLSSAVSQPDWTSYDNIDIPICQCHLSMAVDQASFDSFLHAAPVSRSKALALSTLILHAGDWLNLVPSTKLDLHRFMLSCLQFCV